MNIVSGARLGRYEIRLLLGAGGMGEVYLAHDTQLDRAIALKLLSAELTHNEDRLRRFGQEARAVSKLSHPNVAHIYEIGEAEGRHFIAMEYVEGQPLEAHINGRPLDISEVLRVGIEVADALVEAHAKGITHRDIKPANIMLTPRGGVKVLDFGLAKLAAPAEPQSAASNLPTQVKTSPGMVMGTVNYMSPEQAMGRAVDHRTDIFSLGVMLYEAATGRLPFAGESVTETIDRIAHAQPEAVARFNYNVPAELERIIKKALRKNRDERYQTAQDLLIDLRSLKQETDVTSALERTASPETTSGEKTTMSGAQAAVATIDETAARTEKAEAARTTSSAEYLAGEIKRHKLSAAVALATVIIAAVAAYFYFARSGDAIESIAVLPFTNVGGDPNAEYLPDGITETIINSLSQLPDLRVMSRSSVFRYKGRETDPQAVARELGVEAVVTGRVTQRGDNLSISVEMMDARDNRHLWGEQYNRRMTDILAVQQDISREISERLRLRLTGDERRRVTRSYTDNAEAYQLYLRGEHSFNQFTEESGRRALEYFNQAIRLDPNYALAYTGVANVYSEFSSQFMPPTEAMPRARAAATRALEIDDTLGEAHLSMALILWWGDYDWAGAEREIRRAIELNPNYAARSIYGEFFARQGRFDEAIAQVRRAQELDPLSVAVRDDMGRVFFLMRQYDRAIEQCQRAIELDPNYPWAHYTLGRVYEQKGMYEEAIAELQRAMSLRRHTIDMVTLGHIYAVSGRRDEALRTLNELEELSRRSYVSPVYVARVYAGLGERERAIELLQRGYEIRSDHLTHLKVDPDFDNLRSDPRFQDIMRRVGLSQ